MPTVLWENPNEKTSVVLTKDSGETLTLKVDDFIGFDPRKGGVKVTGFTSRTNDPGPIGMTYLPWRYEEKRWASLDWSLTKGDRRHLIASPCGLNSFGEHVDWNTIKFIERPVEAN